MKRLLKISFDLSLLSFIPIISWLLLGIIVDKNLIKSLEKTYQKKIYVYNKLPDSFFKLCWDYIVK